MWDIVFYLLMIIILAAVGVVGAMLVRNYLNGEAPTAGLFSPKADRRLEVMDHASVDGRRRLILIRRDNVEHLLMTGGPVDVVIETGISPNATIRPSAAASSFKTVKPIKDTTPDASTDAHDADPVFSRQPRTLGQTKSDAS